MFDKIFKPKENIIVLPKNFYGKIENINADVLDMSKASRIQAITSNTFVNCNIKKVILPDTMKYFSDDLYNNNHIGELVFPEHTKEIKINTKCVKQFNIPKEIGPNEEKIKFFQYYDSDKSIEDNRNYLLNKITSKNKHFYYENGCLYHTDIFEVSLMATTKEFENMPTYQLEYDSSCVLAKININNCAVFAQNINEIRLSDYRYIAEKGFLKCNIDTVIIDKKSENTVMDFAAFHQCKIKNLIIEKGIEKISDNIVFNRCEIENIITDSNIIPDNLSWYCKMDTLKLPDSVEIIGSCAFKELNTDSVDLNNVKEIRSTGLRSEFIREIKSNNELFLHIDSLIYDKDCQYYFKKGFYGEKYMFNQNIKDRIKDEAYNIHTDLTKKELINLSKSKHCSLDGIEEISIDSRQTLDELLENGYSLKEVNDYLKEFNKENER